MPFFMYRHWSLVCSGSPWAWARLELVTAPFYTVNTSGWNRSGHRYAVLSILPPSTSTINEIIYIYIHDSLFMMYIHFGQERGRSCARAHPHPQPFPIPPLAINIPLISYHTSFMPMSITRSYHVSFEFEGFLARSPLQLQPCICSAPSSTDHHLILSLYFHQFHRSFSPRSSANGMESFVPKKRKSASPPPPRETICEQWTMDNE